MRPKNLFVPKTEPKAFPPRSELIFSKVFGMYSPFFGTGKVRTNECSSLGCRAVREGASYDVLFHCSRKYYFLVMQEAGLQQERERESMYNIML